MFEAIDGPIKRSQVVSEVPPTSDGFRCMTRAQIERARVVSVGIRNAGKLSWFNPDKLTTVISNEERDLLILAKSSATFTYRLSKIEILYGRKPQLKTPLEVADEIVKQSIKTDGDF